MKKSVVKGFLLGSLTLAAVIALAGCGANKSSDSGELSEKEITIGVTAGIHEQIMEEVAKQAEEDGLTIKIQTFDDYNTPNTALNDGDLAANSYQTIQFLEQQVEDKKLDIQSAFDTIALPLGIYSNKIQSLDDVKEGDKIGVPNDPTNEYRALVLLEEAGLIKLKSGLKAQATKNDITENSKNLDIVELEAAQIANQLDDLTAAAINSNFAMNADLTIDDDAIYHEAKKDNPYYNVLAVQKGHKNDAVIKTLKKYYYSDETKEYIEDTFKGSVVPAF